MSTTPNTPNLPEGVEWVPAEPTLLRAGDSWKWLRQFGDYEPKDGWALQYVLNSPSGGIFKFPDGSDTADRAAVVATEPTSGGHSGRRDDPLGCSDAGCRACSGRCPVRGHAS